MYLACIIKYPKSTSLFSKDLLKVNVILFNFLQKSINALFFVVVVFSFNTDNKNIYFLSNKSAY